MKRKGVQNAALKALIAGAETSAGMKIATTFIAELAELPDEEQDKFVQIGQEQFNILIQSRMATINAAAAAANTEQIKGLLKELIEEVNQLDGDKIQQTQEIIDGSIGIQFGKGGKVIVYPPGKEEKDIEENLIYLPEGQNKYFTGREECLEEIERVLEAGKQAVVTQTISGLGGIGKTQAALEYAWRNKKRYKTILWLGAEHEQSLAAGLGEIVRQLGMEAGKYEQNAEAVRGWLEEEGRGKWLIVFDNVERLGVVKRLLPREGVGHIIVTSRGSDFQELGEVGKIALDKMEAGEAVEFILKRIGGKKTKANKEEAGQLAKEVDYLPLALEQAAGYMVALGIGLKEYREAYREEGARLFGKEQARVRMGDYDESVVTTWGMNFGQVQEESEAAGDLLNWAAFMYADDIPLRLIREAGAELGERIAGQIKRKTGLEEMVELLGRYSLVKKERNSFSMHRLVQEVVRDRLEEEEKRGWAKRCVEALGAVWPDQKEIENWPWCAELTPHGLRAAEWVEEYGFEFEEVALFLNNFAYYLDDQAQYGAAEPLYRRALKIREKSFGPEHPDVAESLNNLAGLLRATNRLKEAEPMYWRALEIDKKSFGPDNPEVATALNNLAGLLEVTNQMEEAEPLYRRALAIDEKAYGPEHPEVATALNNLAGLLHVTNRLEEAEPLYRRALAIDEKSFGLEHPNVAIRLNNLAVLLGATNRTEEAEPMFRRALGIWEKSLGKDHPNVATTLNNLAELQRARGEYKEAEPMYRRAMAIDEKSFGLEHPNVAIRLNNLAVLLRATNRLEEAEPMFRRALGTMRASYGKDHPDTRKARRNLEESLKPEG